MEIEFSSLCQEKCHVGKYHKVVLPYYLSHGHVQLPPSYEDLLHKHNKFTNNYCVNNLIQDFLFLFYQLK